MHPGAAPGVGPVGHQDFGLRQPKPSTGEIVLQEKRRTIRHKRPFPTAITLEKNALDRSRWLAAVHEPLVEGGHDFLNHVRPDMAVVQLEVHILAQHGHFETRVIESAAGMGFNRLFYRQK